MKNLTTPQAIFGGFALVALAIASIPYSSNVVTPAHAAGGVQKVAVCDVDGEFCAGVGWANIGSKDKPLVVTYLQTDDIN